MINFADFTKIEIKIGTISECERIFKSDKLLKLVIDLGNEKRQVVSGILKYYPRYKRLIGKQVSVLTNLEPRKIFGIESQGMLLAADDEGLISLLKPQKRVKNGAIVR